VRYGAVGRFGGPESLPSPEGRVRRASDEGVEVLHERRELGVRIGDEQVIVVRQDAEGMDEHAVAARGEREDVQEDAVREWGRPEEEAPLGAAARGEVGGSGQVMLR
jgi:hypothetical protein